MSQSQPPANLPEPSPWVIAAECRAAIGPSRRPVMRPVDDGPAAADPEAEAEAERPYFDASDHMSGLQKLRTWH